MDYVNLIKNLAFNDVYGNELKDDLLVAIEQFKEETSTFENDLFYSIKKFLIYLASKYNVSVDEIKELYRPIYNLDDLIIRFQIPRINFIGKYISDNFVYDNSDDLYRDFRKMLLNKDGMLTSKKYFVQNYVYMVTCILDEEMSNIEFPEDANIYQFRELFRLIKLSFKRKHLSTKQEDVENAYLANNIIVKGKILKYEKQFSKSE